MGKHLEMKKVLENWLTGGLRPEGRPRELGRVPLHGI
jgi:hypothetical protein